MNDQLASLAGNEFIPQSCTPIPGLPLRPTYHFLLPCEVAHGEATVASSSASSDLVRALGGRPPVEPIEAAEDAEPVDAREARRAPTPEEPTASEREAHALAGHAVFRSWCRHCVRGRGREAAHSCSIRPETAIPVLSWDYCYLTSRKDASGEAIVSSEPSELGSAESPVLVMWDSKSKGPFARIVPGKAGHVSRTPSARRMTSRSMWLGRSPTTSRRLRS